MSHVALRRVIVRLLHDPTLVEALYGDPERALAGADVDAQERAWLLATPRAAWATDPERPARVLAALRDEYPVATSLAPARTAAFFASPAFHDAVQMRGSLALALGAHLAGDPDPRAAAVARLEAAIARVRRAGPVAPEPTSPLLGLAPHALVLRVPAGSLALLAAARDGRRLPALGQADEAVLAVRDGDGATLEPVDPALAALLEAAAAAQPPAALCAVARRLGAAPGEDEEILADLVADGLLVRTGRDPVDPGSVAGTPRRLHRPASGD